MRAAYDEARAYLEVQDKPAAALGICDQWLAKYPDHALFRALNFDIEQRQGQALSAYIAKIDREVDAEPDLERRVALLRDALGKHPSETHFQRALELAEQKRELDALDAELRAVVAGDVAALNRRARELELGDIGVPAPAAR